ncbi:MAG: hypothetical protein ACTSYD_03715 [Candidatus Heimdallarchaeaceae archaeon]
MVHKKTKKNKNNSQEKTPDGSNLLSEDENLPMKVGPNWMRILTLGFLISLVFGILDVIFALAMIYGLSLDPTIFLLSIMEYVLFGEVGLIVFWGACLGNFGQSVFLMRIKERLVGGRPFTKYSFRDATFHSFTYYFAGGFLLLFLLVMDKIVRTIVILST